MIDRNIIIYYCAVCDYYPVSLIGGKCKTCYDTEDAGDVKDIAPLINFVNYIKN
jgi:hypothetical protein